MDIRNKRDIKIIIRSTENVFSDVSNMDRFMRM